MLQHGDGRWANEAVLVLFSHPLMGRVAPLAFGDGVKLMGLHHLLVLDPVALLGRPEPRDASP